MLIVRLWIGPSRHGIPHGGWCPKGRKAEDGPIDAKYQLKETPSSNYLQRTEWNVRDSDGTVIFSVGKRLSGNSFETLEFAIKHRKPYLHLSAVFKDNAAQKLKKWIAGEQYPCAERCWSSSFKRAKGCGICDHHPRCRPQTVMKPLELHDQRHLEAAQGWFELGNCIEATEELEQITPEMRGHPSVLEVRFQIYAAAKKWEYAAEIAKAISEFAPEQPIRFHPPGIFTARTEAHAGSSERVAAGRG